MPEVPGVRHSRVRAGEVTLHVAEAGEGPPLVLLHGWPQHWYLWRDVIPVLAADNRVICPDLRGFGWSDAPRASYDKETLARDVIALLDALGLDRVRLAGHDWGGWTGFLVCLLAPERVERFVALNIPHPFTGHGPRGLLTLWRFAYQVPLALPGLGSRTSRWLASWDSARAQRAGMPWDPAETDTFLGQFAEPARAEAASRVYRSFITTDMPRSLSSRYRAMRLRTPTLILHGTGDPAVRPVHLEGYEPYADDLRVELVPSAGHFIVDEQPDLVATRLRSFLGGSSQAGAETG